MGPKHVPKLFIYDPLNIDNAVEKVHCQSCGSFLRLLAGLVKSVHKESLYKELGGYPLIVQWLVLAARTLWNTVLGKSQGFLASKALGDDVPLMLIINNAGPGSFFYAMSTAKVIEKSKWHPRTGRPF